MQTSIKVLKEDVEEMEKKLKAFARKFEKYGKEVNFSYEIKDETVVQFNINANKIGAPKRIVNFVAQEVVISFEEIKFKDGTYRVVGMVEKINGEEYVNVYDNNIVTYKELENNDFRCEHCGTNRRRNKVYVLYNEEDGSKIQIGSTCIDDYLNNQNALKIISNLDAIRKLWQTYTYDENDLGWDGGVGFKYTLAFETETYIAHLVDSIKENGFKIYKRDYMSTKGTTYADVIHRCMEQHTPTKEAKELANKIKKHFVELYNSDSYKNDFTNKLCYIVNRDYIIEKDFNTATYILDSYKDDERKKKAKENKNNITSKWVGEVGNKIENTLKLERSFTTEGFYGTTYIYNFIDEEGNKYTWFSSKNMKLEEGNEYKVNGTVKKHQEYKGEKQTVITRCKINK